MKIKISKIILSITLLSSLLLSLTSCDEKEEHKIIQYQEEVKLSDGSMIWVDIKRHYGWSGYAPGMGKGAYLPGAVEISWDTGFEGVGRQSVLFSGENAFEFLDKKDDLWYVLGGRTRCSPPDGGVYDGKGGCVEGDGNRLAHSAYLYVVGRNGFVKNIGKDHLDNSFVYNILDIRGLEQFNHSDDLPIGIDGKSVSWQEKLKIDLTRKDHFGDYFNSPLVGQNSKS